MIKGYERLYQGNNRINILTQDKLVHSVYTDMLANKNAFGTGTYETFVSILEQRVGQDNYKKLINVYEAYKDIVKKLQQYFAQENNNSEAKRMAKDLDKEINNRIKVIKQKVSNLENLSVAEIEKLKLELTDLQELKKQNSSINVGEEVNYTDVSKQLKELQVKLQDLKENKVLESDGVKNFEDENFKDKMIQDYVDSTLLPGQEKQELAYRTFGEAAFNMAEIEMEYLTESVKCADQLVDYYEEHDLSTELTDAMKSKSKCLENMETISSGQIQASNPEFTIEPKLSQFYNNEIVGGLESTHFGKNGTLNFTELYSKARNDYKIADEHNIKQINVENLFPAMKAATELTNETNKIKASKKVISLAGAERV